ncbi:hypothetical protein [Streptomyces sp. NPDC048192]|uniref:hypothetical protein n=1 Tax=Streptomyces sp. NPDC048192 TaxID=3365510 RepID=UPI003717188D
MIYLVASIAASAASTLIWPAHSDLAVHDVKVRILSDVALIHGRAIYTVLSNGADQEALHTVAYQKRKATWVCVSPCVIAPGA